MATNNRPLKAYVRFDGSGRIVPGSLILRKNKPKVGKWKEILAYECCNPVVLPALRLMFVDISFANGLVGDATNVNDWNTYLDLPVNGTPFTSVNVSGNEVKLKGGAGITLKSQAFARIGKDDPSYLISVNDEDGMIIELQDEVFDRQSLLTIVSLPQLITAGESCFKACNSLTTLNLPQLITVGTDCFIQCTSLTEISLPQCTNLEGINCFNNCTSLTKISLPVCTNLGNTVLNNNVFYNILGNTIELTVPSALMTCNGGLPDGDIQYLQANNTVTIITT
jgi:hypothetical protein